MNVSVGSYLPTSPALVPEGVGALGAWLRDLCHQAADHGVSSVWTIDHLLTSPPMFTESWYEPLLSLAAVAGVDRLSLGTGVLVLPTRSPVLVAKAISTLGALSGQPVALGVGTGWNTKEFEASGRTFSHRGSLTDEALDVIELMFRGGGSYAGRHFRFDDVSLGDLGPPPTVWVGGGGQTPFPGSVEHATMPDAVARRILRFKRWAIRPSVSVESAQQDLDHLSALAGSSGSDLEGLELLHFNYLYLVETDDRAAAREEQYRQLHRVLSATRPIEHIEACHPVGTIDEVRERLQQWIRFGVRDFVFHPLADPTSQFRLWEKHLSDLFEPVNQEPQEEANQ